MKKDRNTFFQESSYVNQTGFPNQNMGNMPFGTSSYANQGFYAGPIGNVPMNYNIDDKFTSNNMNYVPEGNNFQNNLNDYSEIESRLSKIERQLSRIDVRLNKLEANSFYSTDELDNTTNVYMV